MKLYQEGQKLKAICEDCQDLVRATFAYRDVPFDDGCGIAKGILAAVCDGCNRVIALPAQSTPAIVRARENARKSLDVTLHAWEMDILESASYRIDPDANGRLRETLIAYYLRRSTTDARGAARIKGNRPMKPKRRANGSPMPKRKLSLNLTARAAESLKSLTKSSGLSKSQIIRGVISQIEADLVLPSRPAGMKKFREIAGSLTD